MIWPREPNAGLFNILGLLGSFEQKLFTCVLFEIRHHLQFLDLIASTFGLVASKTHFRRRRIVNGRMTRAYWDCLKLSWSKSASDPI